MVCEVQVDNLRRGETFVRMRFLIQVYSLPLPILLQSARPANRFLGHMSGALLKRNPISRQQQPRIRRRGRTRRNRDIESRDMLKGIEIRYHQ